MDHVGWFVATLHDLLGHDRTAIVLGVPVGDKAKCLICLYEQDPTDEHRQRVINALSGRQ